MKFQVTMGDPDTLYDAIREAVEREVEAMPGLEEDEREGVIETRRERVSKVCSRWFEYGEYLTVEIDTEAGTATVLPKTGT